MEFSLLFRLSAKEGCSSIPPPKLGMLKNKKLAFVASECIDSDFFIDSYFFYDLKTRTITKEKIKIKCDERRCALSAGISANRNNRQP